ncbi:10619_t:CDS:2 [Entrophospora sp. SA101]|nr:10619_t:CDS:2 [Entrophospora sp. SA101]
MGVLYHYFELIIIKPALKTSGFPTLIKPDFLCVDFLGTNK